MAKYQESLNCFSQVRAILPHPILLGLIAALSLLAVPGKAASPNRAFSEDFGGRSLIVYAPLQLPPAGTRALVVVLHGGMGNAQRIESGRSENGLNMDAAAETNGFVVAYLNGTPVTLRLGADKLGWNAGGGCCGQSAANNIDDVSYIQSAVGYLTGKYGIDPQRIYGMGHSNGAMMTQRLVCETKLYAAAVAISGPLNLATANCPAARGNRILAIHGADDANVPIQGGRGTEGISRAVYRSEEQTRQVFSASGASYDLQVVKGADHKLDHLDPAIQNIEGQTIADKAVKFFGLSKHSQ